ncbi:MAG: hypothetical protein AB7F50_01370 [Fimbriimonadaceae bacterium]
MRTTLFTLAAATVLLAATGCNPPPAQDTARSAVPNGEQSGKLTLQDGQSSVDPTASTSTGAATGAAPGNLGRPDSSSSSSTGTKPGEPSPSGTARPGNQQGQNGAGGPSNGQGQGQGQRTGMGMRGMGGMGAAMMLGTDEVKKELKITESQEKELKALMDTAMSQFRRPSEGERPDPQKMQEQIAELQAKVEKILNEDQRKRMDEISLQMQGAGALRNKDVQMKLGMSAKQLAEVEKIDKDSQAEMEKLRNSAGEGERPDFNKMREARDAVNKKILAVLSASQVQKLEAMKGKPFTMPQRARGGGQGGGQGQRG